MFVDRWNCVSPQDRVKVSLVVALFLLLSPAWAQGQLDRSQASEVEAGASAPVGLEGRSFLLPSEELELVVREAYSQLEKYTAAAGEGIEFTLTDFETLRRPLFNEVLWTDLATMPVGAVIDVVPEGHLDQASGVRTVEYQASWSFQEDGWAATEEGRRMIGLTVDQALREVARELPQYEGIVALTRYRVRARLGERERVYDASVLWRPGSEPGQAIFFALDHIVQGLEEAARETRPVPGEAPIELIPVSDASTSGTCESWTQSRTHSDFKSGTNGHITGSHVSSASFQITCSCDSSCNSICNAQVTSYTCSDSGFPADACHKMAVALDTSSDWRGYATTSGAGCAAGMACAQKSCLFCACSLGVSVSAFGTGVTFSATDAHWTGNNQFSATCAPCEEITCGDTVLDPTFPSAEGEDTECGTSGTGGGGGGGGSSDGGDGGTGESCADVYCDGVYSGQACGTTTTEMVAEAESICGL